jgi:type IV pilus assembly protein PilC
LSFFASLIIIFKYYANTKSGRKHCDFLKLKMPIFGRLIQKIAIVRFTRSMNTLIIGGVTISKSLNISSEIVENKVYQDLIQKTIVDIEDGNSISNVFSKSEFMPKIVPQMMLVGEKTGKLDVSLKHLANFYTKEVNNMTTNLMTLMEPVIMVIMGIAVGLMVAAVILPMYNLSGSF